MTRHRGGVSTGLFAVCALVAILAVLPIVIIVIQAFQGGTSAIRDAVSASSSRTLLRNTVLVSLVATPICGVIGVAGAWFVERTRLPGRRLWAVLLVAPLTVPLFVTSYAWATLGVALQGFAGAAGIIAFTYYPIVFLLVAVALRGLDPALEDSARSLGLNPRQIFFRVILPQLRPALLGGLLLVALDALVEFDAFVALRFQTFSLDVYAQYRLGFSASGAAALSFFSIVLCLVLLFGEARLRGDANYTRVSRGARRPPVRYELGRWTLPVLASLAAVVAISVGIPVGMLIRWFTESSSAALSTATREPAVPAGRPAARRSCSVCRSALVALLLALPVALLAVRHGGRFARLAERSTYLSFALPDLVGAIALSYGAVPLRAVPLRELRADRVRRGDPVPPVCGRRDAGDAGTDRARPGGLRRARSAPARSRRFRRVTMPLARPGVVAAIVLVFAFSLGDLATAQVLLPLNLYTLGTEFQANSANGRVRGAAPFAAVLIVLAMAAAYVLMSRFGTVRAFTDDERG